MKRIIVLTVYLTIAIFAFSQAPGMFKYQAVVRDSKGKIMDSENISVIVSILQDSPSGIVIFSENQNVTSTEQGIINLNIGSSNPTGLSSIEWGSHNYFMQVSINGITMGTSQLLSVPYALYAQSSGSSIPGPQGEQGIEGQSAYEVWINAGNTGTESDFFAFLKGEKGDTGENGNNGKSSYELWLEQGNIGTQAEFIASLKGDQGNAGFVPGHEWDNTSLRFQNTDGTWGQLVDLKGNQGEKGDQGTDGTNGKSSYEIWLDQGNSGTMAQFITSLRGEKGDAGFVPGHEWDNTLLRFQNQDGTWGQFVNLKGEQGEKGDPGINGTNGQNGKSSYEIWLEQGNIGTQAQFIAMLKGEKGDAGFAPDHEWSNTSLRFQNSNGTWGQFVNLKGSQGEKGDQGTNGTNGQNGKSSYEIWLDQGNPGTQAQFIASLKGEKGETGLAPSHEWNNTSLRFQNSDGTWGDFVDLKGTTGSKGATGATGATGPQGLAGKAPEHQWTNTSLRFQNPDGSWGAYVDLKGTPGPSVKTFAVCSSAYTYDDKWMLGTHTWSCSSGGCSCSNGILLSHLSGNCSVNSESGSCDARSTTDSVGRNCSGACCVCMAK